MAVVKIFTVAHVPTDLMHAWLQHLRDFDIRHAGCHFEVMSEGPDKPLPEIVEMLRVNPELKFQEFFPRGEKK